MKRQWQQHGICAVVAMACGIVACSGDDSVTSTSPPPSSVVDGSTTGDAGTESDADESDATSPPPFGISEGGTSCSTLAPPATGVSEQKQSGSAPAPAGGTVVDGTYVLTKVDIYSASINPAVRKARIRYTGNKYEQVVVRPESEPYSVSGTFTVSGTTFSYTEGCPAYGGSPMTYEYTATPTEFKLHTTTSVATYTKE
jgi:hypothetical protein